VLSSSSSSAGGRGARSTRLSSSSRRSRRGLPRALLFLEGGAGGLLGDLVVAASPPRRRRPARASGPWRAWLRDRGSRAAACRRVERVRPVDDRVEGDRAFAQAPDHRVAAGLDALGDGDLALAGEQLDRAHLAQVHADRIVGAVDRFLLLLDDEACAGAAPRRRADRPSSAARARPRLASSSSASSFSTTLTPISLSADMTSSICSEDIWSWGRASFSSS
jgi:hypothetical protein